MTDGIPVCPFFSVQNSFKRLFNEQLCLQDLPLTSRDGFASPSDTVAVSQQSSPQSRDCFSRVAHPGSTEDRGGTLLTQQW